MQTPRVLRTGVALAVLYSAVNGVAAASPSRSIPIVVQLDPGSGCWTYHGTVDGFTLRATGGERLLISTAGEADFTDGTHSWKVVERRDVVVAKGTEVVRPDEHSIYRFDSSGKFTLVLGPAAIRGLPSILIVCRAPPEVLLDHR